MLDTLHWAPPSSLRPSRSSKPLDIADGRRCTVQLTNGYLYLDAASLPSHALLGHDECGDANEEEAIELLHSLAPGFACAAVAADLPAAAAQARRMLADRGLAPDQVAVVDAALGEPPPSSGRSLIVLENESVGRSGTWFASLAWRHCPSLIVIGHALSRGASFGAILARRDVLDRDAFLPELRFTGASDALRRVGGTVREVVARNILADAEGLDAYFRSRLLCVQATCSQITAIDFMPLGARITARSVGGGAALKRKLCERGVLVGVDERDRVVVFPPLVIRPAEIDVITGALRGALGDAPTWRLPVCCPACETSNQFEGAAVG